MNDSTNAQEAGRPSLPAAEPAENFSAALKDASSAALRAFDENPASEEDTPAPAAAVSPATPTPSTPAEPAIEPATPAEMEEIQVAGRKLQLNKEQLKQFAQQGVDYTRKTMTLAEERRVFGTERQAFEAERQQAAQVIKQWQDFLNNDEALEQHLSSKRGQRPAAPSPTPGDLNPDDLPTAQQVVQLIKSQVDQARREWDSTHQQETSQHQLQAFQAEVARQESQYRGAIDTHMGKLMTAYPVLDQSDIELIRMDVAKQLMQAPTDDWRVAEGLMNAAAKGRAEILTKKITDHKKMEAVRSAKATRGIEPPGGSAPQNAPIVQPMKLGSKELTNAAIAALEGSMHRG